MKVIVIGGVAAGAAFATRLRRLDERAEILLLERGRHISYASCALPYYLGGVINDRDSLIERTPERLQQENNITVRVQHTVLSIDSAAQIVTVQDNQNNRVYQERYDRLVLATGASPIVPNIPGLKAANAAFTIRSIADADAIQSFIQETDPHHVTLLGAGAAGVELTENFIHRGLAVTLIDAAKQVMTPIDPELAELLATEIKKHGVDLRLNTQVTAVEDDGHTLHFADGSSLATDLLLVVTGVAPNSQLASAAGIAVAADGHIPVDARLQTSVDNIYAIGDVIQTTSRITGMPVNSVLSSAANRQGHLLADIIHGSDLTYPGFIGVSVAQIFDLTVSHVGYTETTLKQAHIADFDAATITPFDHAFFYPNAQRLTTKILYDRHSGMLYGGQFIGHSGVDKRAGELAAAIAGGLSANDLPDLELPYSPPYASTRDVLNVAGYVAINRMQQLEHTVAYAELDVKQRQEGFFLSISKSGATGTIEATANIPVDELRAHLDELPHTVYIIDQPGLGPYKASRILDGNGFNVMIVTA